MLRELAHMPDRLILTKNAQFFLPKEEVSDTNILGILDSAMENIVQGGVPIIDVSRASREASNQGFAYKFSCRVFPSARPVYFIDDEIFDTVFAYILIFEIDGYVAILKRSCANISDIVNELFNRVRSSDLTAIFDDDEVEFQKISIRNMTVSDRALRAKSYEATDLKGLLSTHAAGRSIPYYLKIRQGGTLKAITANSGKIVESSQRQSIEEIATWIKDQILLIRNPLGNKTFLSSFAKHVELPEVLSSTDPCAILIESSSLHDRLEKDNMPIMYKTKSGRLIRPTRRVTNILFAKLEEVYEVENDELLTISKMKDSRLKKNEKSITFHSKPLTRFRVKHGNKEITLQKYIIEHGLYSVCFKDPKYMYFMSSCFEDASGISEIDSILDILTPKTLLSTAESEKGNPSPESTSFDQNSLFGAIEQIHSGDDYIICDDLGIEWADHITLNKSESCICFIHSKHGKETTSASKLHEVVGQGIKNLGNMFFAKENLLQKLSDNKYDHPYTLDSVQTCIARIRRGDIDDIEVYLDGLLSDYKLHRKCVLSCSFLSKTSVAAKLQELKSGQPVAGHVIQLLWIISSFAHAARDMNIIPEIYCCE